MVSQGVPGPAAAITIAQIKRGHDLYTGSGRVAWRELVTSTPDGIKLERLEDRRKLIKFLNRWGCRLQKCNGVSESMASRSLSEWWESHGEELDGLAAQGLTSLTDSDLERVAVIHWDLRSLKAGPRRGVGPVTAAKVLLALGPKSFPAWDREIARVLYGGTTSKSYRAHLYQCRAWAKLLEVNHGDELKTLLKPSERIEMAKLIDESLYEILDDLVAKPEL